MLLGQFRRKGGKQVREGMGLPEMLSSLPKSLYFNLGSCIWPIHFKPPSRAAFESACTGSEEIVKHQKFFELVVNY